MGFLYIALKCFHVLAWPSLALLHPLYASIRAIESNSKHHMRKLISYWILFSLISLFELAFFHLLQWVPIWPYLKLVIVCCLTLPCFEGAYDVYKSFVQPCLHVNIEEVIERLSKSMTRETKLKPENFLALAERYVEENGTEALEKLIGSKVARAYYDVEEIKATADPDESVLAPKMQSNSGQPNLSQEDIKSAAANMAKFIDEDLVQTQTKTTTTVEEKEKTISPEAGEKALPANDTSVKVQEWECAMCQVKTPSEAVLNNHLQGRKHKARCDRLKAQAKIEGLDESQIQKDKKANVAVDDKEILMSPAAEEAAVPANVPFDEVQKEWACAMCQVRTPSEAVLNDHLQGKKHKAQCEKLKALAMLNKVTSPNKGSSPSDSAFAADKFSQVNQTPTIKESKNLQVNSENEQPVKSANIVAAVGKNITAVAEEAQEKQRVDVSCEFGIHGYKCGLCDIQCTSQADLLSHLSGKKHLARVQGQAVSSQGWAFGFSPVFNGFDDSKLAWNHVGGILH